MLLLVIVLVIAPVEHEQEHDYEHDLPLVRGLEWLWLRSQVLQFVRFVARCDDFHRFSTERLTTDYTDQHGFKQRLYPCASVKSVVKNGSRPFGCGICRGVPLIDLDRAGCDEFDRRRDRPGLFVLVIVLLLLLLLGAID